MLVCLFSWKLNETYGKREGGEREERGRDLERDLEIVGISMVKIVGMTRG